MATPPLCYVIAMYRTTLVGTFLGLLALALGAAGLAWWGSAVSGYELERTQRAHIVLEEHLRIEGMTYALFKQLADGFLSNGANRLDEPAARAKLEAQISVTRRAIAAEMALVGHTEDESEELERLAAIERQTLLILDQFREASDLARNGAPGGAMPLLERVLERSIDEDFRKLIEEATAEEGAEVRRAQAAAETALRRVALLSKLTVLLALPLAAVALAILLHRLRRPLERLTQGALTVAAGDLSHRVAVVGRDEFARLATAFNTMVDELVRSRGELEESRRTLEGAVSQRTAELGRANTTLKRVDEIRRRFIADISHELRTPLTIIRGEAEVTLRGRVKAVEEYEASLQQIVEQATHTGRLVDDLLFVARTEAGEPRMVIQPVAFEEVVRRACADGDVLAEPKRVRVELHEQASDAVVQGDPSRLRQLVMILLDNAIRYSEPDGVVEVTLSPGPRGVVLQVADHGIGISEDELGWVFERFYRGENASARYGEGSGLGLPLAKAIAEAHGGEISLSSRPGEGTTARVVLPTVRKLRMVA